MEESDSSDEEESAPSKEVRDNGDDSDNDVFEDALEHLTIADEQPRAIAVAA